MARISPLIRDMEIPLSALTKGAGLILIEIKPTYSYVNQQRSDTIVGYSHTVVEDKKFNRFLVKVDSATPLLTEEQIAKTKDHLYVKFENAFIKLYTTQNGDVEVSIKAASISLQK